MLFSPKTPPTKNVSLWVRGSGNGYFEGVLVFGQHRKAFMGEVDSSSPRVQVLSGILFGLDLLNQPANVLVYTCTSTGMEKPHKGRMSTLKASIKQAAEMAGHVLTYQVTWSDQVKNAIRKTELTTA